MLSCRDVGVLDIRTAADADQPAYLERLGRADVVLFSGGNQSRLRASFGKSEFLRRLNARYHAEANFVVAGTSAGAMAMSAIMIRGGSDAGRPDEGRREDRARPGAD